MRIGVPQSVSGLHDVVRNPIYSTGVGLLMYGLDQQQTKRDSLLNGKSVGSVFQTLKNWFKGEF